MKYFLVDESDDVFYFKTIREIVKFLGADASRIKLALDYGDVLLGYTIDEVIN